MSYELPIQAVACRVVDANGFHIAYGGGPTAANMIADALTRSLALQRALHELRNAATNHYDTPEWPDMKLQRAIIRADQVLASLAQPQVEQPVTDATMQEALA